MATITLKCVKHPSYALEIVQEREIIWIHPCPYCSSSSDVPIEETALFKAGYRAGYSASSHDHQERIATKALRNENN